jgi:FimV-like protein
MKIQVQPMGPQIASLKQMITEMATLLSAQSGASHTGMSRWFMVLLIWCVVLTLLVLFILLSNRKKKLFHSELETGGDYDYLSKEDSSPSHLNLAQTYITMNDYERARKSLEFVIMHSKGELKDKAMQLLKQLPKG